MKAVFPVPPPLNLAPIVTEVDRQLRGRLREFTIDHADQGLVLSGAAASFYVKQLAQHAVGQLTRLPVVRNEIQVPTADRLEPIRQNQQCISGKKPCG